MTSLGRYAVSSGLLAALLALPCVCRAMPQAYEEPTQSELAYCDSFANLNYAMALEVDSDLTDMAHEDAMADCLSRTYSEAMRLAELSNSYGIEQVAGGWVPTSLNEDIAADTESRE